MHIVSMVQSCFPTLPPIGYKCGEEEVRRNEYTSSTRKTETSSLHTALSEQGWGVDGIQKSIRSEDRSWGALEKRRLQTDHALR